jgi:hypothetical protein
MEILSRNLTRKRNHVHEQEEENNVGLYIRPAL